MSVAIAGFFSRNHILEKGFISKWIGEGTFFNGGRLHFLAESFIFTCFDGRREFKKISYGRGMLPTGGKSAVGT